VPKKKEKTRSKRDSRMFRMILNFEY
jgi:hypothetical protein